VLKVLALLNNDWWAATCDELLDRRLQCLNAYFPMIKNGYLQSSKADDDVHIENTCISPNAFLRIGKLLKTLATRKPHARHPSYACLFDNDIFQEFENDPDADIRFFNTLYFILGCASCESTETDTRKQIQCNVCLAYILLHYMFINANCKHSRRILRNTSMRQAISEKLACLQRHVRRRYVPPEFKQRIIDLIAKMHSIGF